MPYLSHAQTKLLRTKGSVMSETLKAGLGMKNESGSAMPALHTRRDWLHPPANVLCLHWGMCSEQPWKVHDSVHQEKRPRPEKLGKEFPWVWLNLKWNTQVIWQTSAEEISTVLSASLHRALGPFRGREARGADNSNDFGFFFMVGNIGTALNEESERVLVKLLGFFLHL